MPSAPLTTARTAAARVTLTTAGESSVRRREMVMSTKVRAAATIVAVAATLERSATAYPAAAIALVTAKSIEVRMTCPSVSEISRRRRIASEATAAETQRAPTRIRSTRRPTGSGRAMPACSADRRSAKRGPPER
jgi:hypothetical protein